MTSNAKIDHFDQLANTIRIEAIKMTSAANSSHVGSCLSIADLLAQLYGWFLNISLEKTYLEDRDIFILSKGHAAAALYATLSLKGFFSRDLLSSFQRDGTKLGGHVTRNGVPGVELSTGSLGHGLPVAVGFALASLKKSVENKTVVLVSDGELNEGSNWEAILFAPAWKLSNLILIVDYNKIQSLGKIDDIAPLEPLSDKFTAFGWEVIELNGNSHMEIFEALSVVKTKDFGKPVVLIAHTIKGYGVKFMENSIDWHYKSVPGVALDDVLHNLKKNVM